LDSAMKEEESENEEKKKYAKARGKRIDLCARLLGKIRGKFSHRTPTPIQLL
jgi:hypothetical protein